MFDISRFENELATSWLGRSLYFFKELPSTNTYAKQFDAGEAIHGTVVLTEHQTKGRGQHQHLWVADAGKNLTFSLIFQPQRAERLNLLTLACALSVKDTIYAQTGLSSNIKWPNDVLYEGRKLCGILTETVFIGNKLDRVIVGIGVNVNQDKFRENLVNTASSLKTEWGKELAREDLMIRLLMDIEHKYRLWKQEDSDLLKKINKALIGYGEWLHLTVNGVIQEGEYKFLGANNAGGLVALDEDMNIKTYAFEQVRVIHPG